MNRVSITIIIAHQFLWGHFQQRTPLPPHNTPAHDETTSHNSQPNDSHAQTQVMKLLHLNYIIINFWGGC